MEPALGTWPAGIGRTYRASSSPNEISIRHAISGWRERTSRQAVTPSPSGSRTSRTATSGVSAGNPASAASPVPASPTAVMLGSASSRSVTPRLRISRRARTDILSNQRRQEAMVATSVGLDAVETALLADDLLRQGDTLQSVWRYAIIQLLDDYSRDLARDGASVASRRFTHEPARTSSPEVDAALAALAEHLARRDDWSLPPWARKPGRYSAKWWFVTPLRGMHPTALQESPPSFRTRGIFITAGALSRV